MTKDNPTPAATADAAAPKDKDAKTGNGKIWMGTAVGVGSAALVAALMYARRRK